MLIRYEADLQDHGINGHTHFPQWEEGPWNEFRQFSHSEVSSFWSQVAVFSQILRPKSIFSVFTYQSSSLPLFLPVFFLFIFLFFLLCYYSYFFFFSSNFFIFPLPLPSSFVLFLQQKWLEARVFTLKDSWIFWDGVLHANLKLSSKKWACSPRHNHATCCDEDAELDMVPVFSQVQSGM